MRFGPPKGETDADRDAVRESKEYLEWRQAVIEYQGAECQTCGERKELHVHHIKSFYYFPKLRLERSNGLVLCARCHAEIHGYEYDGKLEPVDARIYDAEDKAFRAGYEKGYEEAGKQKLASILKCLLAIVEK